MTSCFKITLCLADAQGALKSLLVSHPEQREDGETFLMLTSSSDKFPQCGDGNLQLLDEEV
jgi:hypothetical protein